MAEKSIDINCDLGESFGAYRMGFDSDVMRYISSANIACGWHAGDSLVMEKTVRMATCNEVAVGAHPGYPDLVGFGRRHMDCTAEEIRSYLTYQIGALNAFCVTNSVEMRHVKPHGALYMNAMKDERVGEAICEAVAALNPNLVLFVMAGQQGFKLASIASSHGLRVCMEAFPDRQYDPGGNLTPRSDPNAVLSDTSLVAQRALMMAIEGRVKASDGSIIELEAKTLCVHGDNEAALGLVREIRRQLEREGVAIRPAT